MARAPWSLEELELSYNFFHGAGAGPALAALARRRGLRSQTLDELEPCAAGFEALVEAAWPALTSFSATLMGRWEDEAEEWDRWTLESSAGGADALGAAAFAGPPALEVLDLSGVALGEAGAALLASRRWTRLSMLFLK